MPVNAPAYLIRAAVENYTPRADGLDALREEYLIRRAFLGYDYADKSEIDAAIEAAVAKSGDRSPVGYVAAATVAAVRCRRCVGTGRYITGTVNGVPTGPGGDCYRCGGAGAQTSDDGIRNAWFDCRDMGRG